MMSPQGSNNDSGLAARLKTATVDELAKQGVSPDELILAIRQNAERNNRNAQAALSVPANMPSADWDARRKWLLDGQPIYGELKEFYFPALAALKADDQAEYSRSRDLLFKALRTFLGDPPPDVPTA